ncbi:uncharacterized protein LOC126555621 [Aphis gossypii]|uniref:uncharacterized protein LOC126555621 n=1 Tax=Aphis gossypii TaxID=80765 RepID=UPI002158DB93|nr:uncharacterized protein LOC126555621 [Aphis gossypii]
MVFVDSVTKKKSSAPQPRTIQNWIKTIRGFQNIYKVMAEYGVHSLLLRNFNQDPIENFFGAIRSLGYRSNNPSTQGFSSAYKTLMLNNLTTSHSIGSNCEEDFSEGALASYNLLFSSMINNDDTQNIYHEPRVDDGLVKNKSACTPELSYLKFQTQNYIAGFIIKKLNTILFKNCKICIGQICTNSVGKSHDLMLAREYNEQLNLKYPNVSFCRLIQGITDLIYLQLPSICHRLDYKLVLISKIQEQFNLNILNCPIHSEHFENKILNFSIKLLTNHWCVEVNRILNGKKKKNSHEKDNIKIAAANRYNKFSKFKSKTIFQY